MLSARPSGYLWVTWLVGLLAGEDHCAWAAWLRAHYQYTKRPDENPDGLSRWKAAHDDLVKRRARELLALGWLVDVEGQNKITVQGRTTVGGQPDIVATLKNQVLVSDCKTGSRKHKDLWQVRVYMGLLPHAKPLLCKGRDIIGEVEYPDGRVTVTLTPEDWTRITEQIRLFGQGAEPPTSPSVSECRFCNISECPDRVVVEVPVADAKGAF